MIKKFLFRLSTALAIVSVVLLISTHGTTIVESPQLSSEEMYEIALSHWVDKVIQEESHGKWDVQIIDSNGKWSRGCLQYQDSTWASYTKKYGIQGSPLNCDTAKKVAIAMIKDNHGLWKSWWTTVVKKGVGKPPLLSDFT